MLYCFKYGRYQIITCDRNIFFLMMYFHLFGPVEYI